MKRSDGLLLGLVITCLLIVPLFISCAPSYKMYGVLLWSTDETNLPNGTLLGIENASDFQKTYQVGIPGSSKNGLILEQWRIRAFDHQDQALTWIQNNQEYLNTYATALSQPLPVRTKADRQAAIVYRLRKGESFRVLGRSSEMVQEGNLKDYWYEVLTSTGVQGFTFGNQIRLGGSTNSAISKGMTATQISEMLRDNTI
jgi:hypothetical protein